MVIRKERQSEGAVTMAHQWLRVGAKVEVTSSLPCSGSKYFAATLIAPSSDSDDKYLVEHETLVREEDDGTWRPLQEDVSVGVIRPRPPPDTRIGFRCGDRVDVLFNGSWWQGVVTKLLHKSRYMVHLECVDQSYQFQGSELRIHRDWTTDGRWLPAFETNQHDVKQEQVELALEEGMEYYQIKQGSNKKKTLFSIGTLVEVRSDEDGFQGAWYAAKIVKVGGRMSNKYVVEYQDLRSDISGEECLKEEVDVENLRPYPLKETVIDGYNNHDKVDALYNDGWWEGEIRRVFGGCMYLVYFDGTEDELVKHQSQLRPHRDWIDGNWVTSPSTIPRKPPQKSHKNNNSKKRRHSAAT